KLLIGSPCHCEPPRRFAPPLLVRGGEIRAGLPVPSSFAPVSLSPPHSRRSPYPLLIRAGFPVPSSFAPVSLSRPHSPRFPCPLLIRAGFPVPSSFAPVSLSPPLLRRGAAEGGGVVL